ncbi:MAG: type IV secretion system DNA-binding domain-containing protein [Candidatus Levybacteria bacterium]|nr:type IV secretion system DNA-binding domain-containing protein [Candidatus Levybacteria bacterium]MBI2420802.1 type IV secretion system DNA-binding domain-containing protein [Candidatus Levybacteria bacterium]MBI4098244.1 type IV secretion system DNA-binding domain-containing protein [Candidatus Levybacteria bacterium]
MLFDPISIFITVFFLLIFLAGLAGFLMVSVYIFFLWYKHRNREKESLDSTLLQVALPRDNEIKIDATEQLLTSFASLRKSGRLSFMKLQPNISLEIVGMPGDIRFYVSVPNKYRDFVEKQINGAYPDAEIKEVEEGSSLRSGFVLGNDYNIFSESGKVAFASLKLKSSNYLPIKVYKDLPTDPLLSITSTLAKMTEGEGAAIQILIAPADNKWKKLGKTYLSKTKKNEANPETAKYSADAKELEGIENKVGKPGFEAIIRIVVSSSTKESAEAHLNNIVNGFSQFTGANSFKKGKDRFKKMFMTDFIFRFIPMRGSPSILTTEEIATIFHFPNKAVTTPHIHWISAKRAPAPASIPESGLYLGKSTYRGLSRPIYMGKEDRQRHMYIIGKTGTGKSELLKQMIMQDIKEGQGVAVIDPHGDLIEDVLQLIPPERAEDVILFDPSDTQRPMGLNMLEANTEEEKHYVVSSIINLMYKLYDPNKTGIIGPRFEHGIRNAMLTVMSEPGSTFIEVVRVMTDSRFVQELLPKVQDPIVRRYWTDQIAQTSDFHKSEVLDYTVSKFGRFVTNKMMRNIIGQSKSSFDFRETMDQGKILLINLSKGKIGEENSSFLGLILVPKILIAAMSRQNMPMDQRRDFFLYVDEFQNFATPDFAQILSEARKYRLNLIVANQFIGQMEEEVKNAIFGNVGTIASFRVGVTDANYLQHEFQPTFTEADLINIDRFNAYVRTVVNGEPVPPFSLDTTKDLGKEKAIMNPRVSELIKELSRLKYGKDVNVIESLIGERAQL